MRQTAKCSLAVMAYIIGSPAVAQSQTEYHDYDTLGRLVVTETQGGENGDQARSYCYDELGNRKTLKLSDASSTLSCAPPSSSQPPSSPPPAPPPPTPPSNSPPKATDDYISVGQNYCDASFPVNLTSNDTDAEDNPNKPVLVSITNTSGGTIAASVISDSDVQIDLFGESAFASFEYVIEDSAGLTDSAALHVQFTGCGNQASF